MGIDLYNKLKNFIDQYVCKILEVRFYPLFFYNASVFMCVRALTNQDFMAQCEMDGRSGLEVAGSIPVAVKASLLFLFCCFYDRWFHF